MKRLSRNYGRVKSATVIAPIRYTEGVRRWDAAAMVEQKYIDYWRDRQARQQQSHRQLAHRARQEAQAIAHWLVQHYPVQRVILFGSLARDRFVAESDIDLAVAGLPTADFFTILAEVNRLSSRWVDLKPWEDLDPYFQSRVVATGEVLYERD